MLSASPIYGYKTPVPPPPPPWHLCGDFPRNDVSPRNMINGYDLRRPSASHFRYKLIYHKCPDYTINKICYRATKRPPSIELTQNKSDHDHLNVVMVNSMNPAFMIQKRL